MFVQTLSQSAQRSLVRLRQQCWMKDSYLVGDNAAALYLAGSICGAKHWTGQDFSSASQNDCRSENVKQKK